MAAAVTGSRFVYLVFSHRRPAQVERLVNRILELSPTSQVVLHHDGRREPMVWTSAPGPRVHVVDQPQPVAWGEFSQVAATLRVLRFLEGRLEYDWCVCISGQDYPVRDLAGWERDVAGGDGDFLLRSREVAFGPGVRRRTLVEDEAYTRYAYRWMRLGPISKWAAPVANRLARIVGADPVVLTRPFRRYPRLGIARSTIFNEQWRCYKGPSWMALSKTAVRRILEVVDERPALGRFYARTLNPDESLLQSILYNDRHLKPRAERMTFTVWKGENSPHPNLIGLADVEEVVASGCAFARKFDIDIDEAALDAVDAATGPGARAATP